MKPLLITLALVPSAFVARAEEPPLVAISVAVATDEGQPVVDAAWLEAQVAEANRLYAVVPLRFRLGAVSTRAAPPLHVVTRADRDAIAGRLVRGAINLRVAASLDDVDEPGRVRRGVHWHLRDRRKHFIILSAIAGPSVLAHELGHFFGNSHSPVPDNLMSYERRGGALLLDERQIAIIRRTLRALLRSGELAAIRSGE